MSRLSTPRPRNSFSSSSNDSRASTPTTEREPDLRILTQVPANDLVNQHYINAVQEYCRRHGAVICLQLGRRKFNRRSEDKEETFLKEVFRLPAFRALQGFREEQFFIVTLRRGGEWRKLPAEVLAVPISHADILNLGRDMRWDHDYTLKQAPWNEIVQTMREEYLLVVHADSLLFAEVSDEATILEDAPDGSEREDCALCQAKVEKAQFDSPCLFHPGFESSETPDTKAPPGSNTTSQEEHGHSATWTWQCCGREGEDPGCVAAARHMTEDEVDQTEHTYVHRYGERRTKWIWKWTQPELYYTEAWLSWT